MRALLLGALVGCAAPPDSGAELVGDVAPDFALEDVDGVQHRLSDQAGGVVVLEFSAMWCTRCQHAAPELEELHQRRASDGVTVWGILFQNAQGQDPGPDDLTAWADEFGLTHPVLADRGEKAFDAWGSGHQPVLFVVDADQQVVWAGDGHGQTDAIDGAIDDAL